MCMRAASRGWRSGVGERLLWRRRGRAADSEGGAVEGGEEGRRRVGRKARRLRRRADQVRGGGGGEAEVERGGEAEGVVEGGEGTVEGVKERKDILGG